MTRLSQKRTYSTSGPECPYCGRQYTPDEPHYYDESNYTEQECDDCGNTFMVEVYHSTSWTCEAFESTPPPRGER